MIVRQPLCGAVGCTQASNVIDVPRFKLVALLTNTRSFTPSKESALPNLPVVQVAPVIDPVLPLPDTSSTVVPAFSSNEYAAARPAAGRASVVAFAMFDQPRRVQVAPAG